MKEYRFKKHIIDEYYKEKGYDNPKDYCLSLIDIPYTKIRFCEVSVFYPLDGILWNEGKDKMCNNKLYQIQVLE